MALARNVEPKPNQVFKASFSLQEFQGQRNIVNNTQKSSQTHLEHGTVYKTTVGISLKSQCHENKAKAMGEEILGLKRSKKDVTLDYIYLCSFFSLKLRPCIQTMGEICELDIR